MKANGKFSEGGRIEFEEFANSINIYAKIDISAHKCFVRTALEKMGIKPG